MFLFSCFLLLLRDQAVVVKADVDQTLASFGPVEKSLSDIEDKVQNSTDLMEGLKRHLMEVGTRRNSWRPQL